MRFSTAYYLFLLYLTVVFQPLIPICTDAVAHTFEDAIHIATVHAKYGNNHVEVALANTADDNEKNKNHNAAKVEDQVNAHFAEDEYSLKYPANTILTTYQAVDMINLTNAFIAKHSPPPKFSKTNQMC